MINRRTLLKLAAAVPALRFAPAFAEDQNFVHAISLFEAIKYKPDFKAFDYVNAAAPKGGTMRLPAIGSFDSLNPYTVKGDPFAISIDDTLFKRSLDEPGTSYGLIAESLSYPADISKAVFKLRPEARPI